MKDRNEYFRQYRATNREKLALKNKTWWANNPTKSREYARKRREQNPDENKLKMQVWRAANPERAKEIGREGYYRNHEKRLASRKRYKTKRTNQLRERQRKWMTKKRQTDPIFAMITNFRSRLYLVLKGKSKSASTMRLLGCSIDDFRIYIESLFESGMSWTNYGNKKGQWSCDHFMPFAIFDLSKPEHQRRCCHFSNLRPMWHIPNLQKGAKPITDQFNLL